MVNGEEFPREGDIWVLKNLVTKFLNNKLNPNQYSIVDKDDAQFYRERNHKVNMYSGGYICFRPNAPKRKYNVG